MRPEDTSPEAWRILVQLYRKMSPEQKLERTFELSEFLRSVCEAGVRSQYPNASEREVFLRARQRTLGHDLFRRAYGEVIPQE